MRFDSLHIPAFGPFTDLRLPLPAGSPDIHLIHGPNEAGKSSLLRALHHLLYGIPARTEDNFLHPNKQLQIGGVLRQGGETLSIYRRKGNKNTLVDEQAQVIPDRRLSQLIGQVSESFFQHMFGLDTAQLRSGAAQLLAGEGDLGTLLFSASLGGNRIDLAIEKLQQEADGLAKGRAFKNVRIPEAVKRYKEALKAEKEQTITAREWRSLAKELSGAQEEFARQDSDLHATRLRARFLDAVLNALPLMQQRQEVQAILTGITLPPLPADFPQQVRHWQNQASDASASLQALRQRLQSEEDELASLPANQEILADQATIESLNREFTIYQKQQQEILQLEQARQHDQALLHSEARRHGVDPTGEPADLPDPTEAQLILLEEAREHLETARTQWEKTAERVGEIEREEEQRQRELDNLSRSDFPASWAALLSEGQRHLARRHDWEEKENQRRVLTLKGETLHHQLGLTAGENPADLVPPAREAVTALLEDHRDWRREDESLTTAERETREELALLELELSHLLGEERELATAENLAQARSERDEFWQALRSLSAREASDPMQQERYQNLVTKADRIADRLIENAEEMALAAQKERDRERKLMQRKQLSDNRQEWEEKRASWQRKWSALLSFQRSHTFQPEDILTWLDRLQAWQENELTLRQLGEELARRDESEQALTQKITSLTHLEGDLDTLLILLEERKSRAERSEGALRALTKELEKLAQLKESLWQQKEQLSERLSHCQEHWASLLADQQLPAEGNPRETLTRLRSLSQLRRQVEELTTREARLQSLREQEQAFSNELASCFARHFASESDLPASRQMSLLWTGLKEARERQTQRASLEKSLSTTRRKLHELEAHLSQAEEEQHNLARRAAVEHPDQLDDCLQQHQERERQREKKEALEEQLLRLAQGAGLEDFLARCVEENPAQLEQERAAIEQSLQERQDLRDQSLAALQDLQRRKAGLEIASSAAAEARQDAQNALAEIITHSERFLRLHHAIDFLRAQIEAFREQSQGPLVALTSRYFATLTNHSFQGVAARPQEDGTLHLVALRTDGNEEHPPEEVATRALSEGTRDQLFLALRLAAIEHHLEHHPAMPLILDDVLMTFDDSRTAALLRALAPLARKTQVLIFTHHRHLHSVATQALPGVHCHDLPSLASLPEANTSA
ncbi:ATP-binding protein [Roseibacillus ishigakijimensis]|uniref:AAA family ATPase n=1 Tax=Roseibacillus ishigakijimensis TaxID=454146 RepID=A0A934RKV8_9BACT|nr:YhaN family protein [Roseibacillus ishigakijimensis]MBK1832600.1 AAA family ATPase [Roseibacillus ishigakijimensis]